MAREVTSIYIDDSAIWVLVARGRQPQLWATMPLEPGVVRDGVVLDEDAVADKVKELWQIQEIKSRRVVAGISGVNCLYRMIILPELPRDLLAEAVKKEADRVLGVPMEQVYLYWQSLPSLTGETLVYLAASPRNSVDALLSTLKKAGLDLYLMDLKPLAIARTVTDPMAIIIDLQSASFDVVIMAERIPQVIRSLTLPQDISMEEKIPVIREEMDRAITFYNSSHMDNPIEVGVPLLVSGELARHEDVWQLLVGRQQRSVQVVSSLMEIPEGFPSSQYVVNIGLALKEVLASEKGAIAYSLVNFNAVPELYMPKARSLSEVLLIPTIVVGIALVAFAAFANISASNRTAELYAELAAMDQRATSQHVRAEDIVAFGKQVSSVEATADAFTSTLSDLAVGREEINTDLTQIHNSLSVRGVYLDTITYGSGTATVKGSADDEDAVFRYARDLRTSDRFVLVVITSMSGGEDEMAFTLTLTK